MELKDDIKNILMPHFDKYKNYIKLGDTNSLMHTKSYETNEMLIADTMV